MWARYESVCIGTSQWRYICMPRMTSNEHKEIFCIGNIYDGTDDDKRRRLAELYSQKKLAGLNCGTCRFNRICDGGCVANNYMITGDINHVPNTYCRWYQLMLNEAIYIANNLGDCQMFIEEWRRRSGRRNNNHS